MANVGNLSMEDVEEIPIDFPANQTAWTCVLRKRQKKVHVNKNLLLTEDVGLICQGGHFTMEDASDLFMEAVEEMAINSGVKMIV